MSLEPMDPPDLKVIQGGEWRLLPPERRATVPPPPPALSHEQRILDSFLGGIHRRGVVGEDRLAKLTYLVITSRLLDDPVSLAVKGPSSGGKSYTVERTTDFFPPEATHKLTGMSERALVYSKEPVAHRTLLLYEYVALRTGMAEDQTSYFVRTLLSEGVLRYETVEKTKEGMVSRIIEKEGPTNLIVTTTEIAMHPENETRSLSVTVDDTREQTRRILRHLAQEGKEADDLTEWHELQRWLQGADNRVEIPFASYLADNIPDGGLAVRLRRDFGAILSLIRTHALLHQATRDRDELGRIIATDEDYVVVRGLVADLISEGLGATVSTTMRETVEAVEELHAEHVDGVPATMVGDKLGLDKSAARRRLRAAAFKGYVKNLEERKGRPGQYVPGDPLPDEVDLLPPHCHPIDDETAGQPSGGTVASAPEGLKEGAEEAIVRRYQEGERNRFTIAAALGEPWTAAAVDRVLEDRGST